MMLRRSHIAQPWFIILTVLFAVFLLSSTSFALSDVTLKPAQSTTRFFTYIPLVTHKPVTSITSQFTWSTPIGVSPTDRSIWVVNPDSGSVSVINADQLVTIGEIAVGHEPWSLAIAPTGDTVYVVDRAEGTLVVVDSHTHTVQARLPVGPEPQGVVLNPTGTTAYITLGTSSQIVVVNTVQLQISAYIIVGPQPYALAIGTLNGIVRLYVTHLLATPEPESVEATDNGRAGHITVIDATNNTVINEIVLPPDSHGFPNVLAGIAASGTRAWVPQVRAAPDLPNGLTTTVFAAVSSLDLTTDSEDSDARLMLNDQQTFGSPVNDPVSAIPTSDGTTLYVTLAGSNLVEVIDVADPDHPRLIKFLPAGQNPRGMAISADERWGYVMSYLSRSVTVLDLQHLERVAEVPVTAETLDPVVLRGKVLFNTAADPRMAQVSWVSCATCHMDGGTDGVTWMFPDGPRQTPPLWNARWTLPWHWSAALDEPQDVEDTIQVIQRGLGLATGADPPLLGEPLAGHSTDLDALAAFVTRGIRAPVPPLSKVGVEQGRQIFASAGCATCHGGPHWTSSSLAGAPGTLDADGNGMVDTPLHDVGTRNPRDVRGATGFDPPSLLNVGLTAPYLHDGSMPTLEALLRSGHPAPSGDGNGLSPEALAQLITFLRSIGPQTLSVELQ